MNLTTLTARDPLLREIAKLRDRNNRLEEENRQLREAWLPSVALPSDWRLTKTEARLLVALFQVRCGHMSRDRMLVALYGLEVDVDAKIIDVLICKVRGKLRAAGIANPIQTYHGDGFALTREGRALLSDIVVKVEPVRAAA